MLQLTKPAQQFRGAVGHECCSCCSTAEMRGEVQGSTCLEILVQQDKAALGKAIWVAHAADLQHRQAVTAAKLCSMS